MSCTYCSIDNKADFDFDGIYSIDTTNYVKQRWGKEPDIDITEDMRLNAWETHSSSTNSRTWRDFCWKNLICFFITLYQKSEQTGTQLCCWRECGETLVDHPLVLWFVPLIQTFWKEVATSNCFSCGKRVHTRLARLYPLNKSVVSG